MATSLDPEEAKRLDRRQRVLIGELPPDFLTLGGVVPAGPGGGGGGGGGSQVDGQPLTQQQIQEQMDEQAALALHQQLNALAGPRHAHVPQQLQPSNIRGRLLISVMQVRMKMMD
jgi:hypothetical protein